MSDRGSSWRRATSCWKRRDRRGRRRPSGRTHGVMRRAVVLAVLVLAALPASAWASGRAIKIASSQRLSGRLTDFTLTTPAFDFRPHVRVLLPGGYATHPRRRYPVLYLLHGSFDDAASWTAK